MYDVTQVITRQGTNEIARNQKSSRVAMPAPANKGLRRFMLSSRRVRALKAHHSHTL